MDVSTLVKALNAAGMSDQQMGAFINALPKDAVVLGKCDTSYHVIMNKLLENDSVKKTIVIVEEAFGKTLVKDDLTRLTRAHFNKMTPEEVVECWEGDMSDIIKAVSHDKADDKAVVPVVKATVKATVKSTTKAVAKAESVWSSKVKSGPVWSSAAKSDEPKRQAYKPKTVKSRHVESVQVKSKYVSCIYDLTYNLNGGKTANIGKPCNRHGCTYKHIKDGNIEVHGYDKDDGGNYIQYNGSGSIYKERDIWYYDNYAKTACNSYDLE
jgi:RNase P/RNase MRP subunit POP5